MHIATETEDTILAHTYVKMDTIYHLELNVLVFILLQGRAKKILTA